MTFTPQWEAILGFITLFLVTALFSFGIDKMSLQDFGLRLKGRGPEFGFGIALGMVMVFVIFQFYQLQGSIEFIDTRWSASSAILTWGIFYFALVSLAEEFLFRGYFFNHYCGSMIPALIISAIFFAAMHQGMGLVGYFNVFLVGIVFGLMYLWSGSLWMPMGFHFSWNFMINSILGLSGGNSLIVLDVNVIPEETFLTSAILLISLFLTRGFLMQRGSPCPLNAKIGPKLNSDIIQTERAA